MILNENVDRKIIPVAGGKGGVGKSVLATNMALAMALFGKKTVLVDMDLGGSNIHTLLGVKNVNAGIGNFISGRTFSMNDLVCTTNWENLYFIPGDVLVYGVGELSKAVKNRIIKGLLENRCRLCHHRSGQRYKLHRRGLLSDFQFRPDCHHDPSIPPPPSVMNGYSFLKNYVFRFLQRAFASDKTVSSYLKKILKEPRPGGQHTVREIVAEIAAKNPEAGEKAEAFLEVLQPKLVLNKLATPADVTIAEGLRDLCKKNLSINLECLGNIIKDEIVDDSVTNRRPFILDYPDDIITDEILRISQKVIQSIHYPEMPLELDYYSDSFELAQIEAENDLAVLSQYEQPESGNDDERYDVDKLVELVRIQQEKIQELQSTLRMLSFGQN